MQFICGSEEIDDAVRSVLTDLIKTSNNDRVLVDVGGRLVLHAAIQSVFNDRHKTPIEASVSELIMTHLLAAEQVGPGSLIRCAKVLLDGFDRAKYGLPNTTTEGTQKSTPWAQAWYPSETDISWLMATTPVSVRHIVFEALKLAGFGGKIVVEKTKASMASVELIRGYTFEHGPCWKLNARYDRPRIVCIDGMIETVGEVHHILEAASSAKEPVIMFVRGMHEDVVHTLKVNYDRGALIVVPIMVKFGLEGMNTLVDIATVCGSDVVSSLKGELISSIKYELLPYVESVVVHGNKTVIKDATRRSHVAIHVKKLREKRKEQQVDDFGKLMDDRIKSLSPNHVVIRYPDDRDYVINAQATDHVLRSMRSLVEHGTLDVMGQKTLVTTAVATAVYSRKCLSSLLDLGCVITSLPK